MRFAVSVWNERISPVFDAAGRLLLVDIKRGQECARHEEILLETIPSRRVRRLADLGVTVLICGAISRPLLTLVVASGISVYPWTAGPVEEVVQAYLSGQIHKPEWRMPGCGGVHQRRRGGRRGCAPGGG